MYWIMSDKLNQSMILLNESNFGKMPQGKVRFHKKTKYQGE